jgi:hypothetical protein
MYPSFLFRFFFVYHHIKHNHLVYSLQSGEVEVVVRRESSRPVLLPDKDATVPVPEQEQGDQSAQHGYAGDEQMVRRVTPGGEELALGDEHADCM